LIRGEETLLAALASEICADAGPAVAARRPELAAGVALVAATETFAPTAGAYDGRVGPPSRRGSISATALETLGGCPLRYFFRHVLHVDAPKTPPTPFEADRASVGSRVHDVLHEIYARLIAESAFDESSVDARITRAREILREAWGASAGENELARVERFPILSRIESRAWLTALGAFLGADLRRLASERLVPKALELKTEGPIPGGPKDLTVRARLDRVLSGADGGVVSDYKTGRKLKDRVQVGAMLSGTELQVPIYALTSGLPVELLGVGADPDVDRVPFSGFKSDEQRAGFLETLRVVTALIDAGRFPIRPGRQCNRCDYRSACRRGHPPTEYREDHAADVRDARDCWSKTDKLPSLVAVRREVAS
jgi:RecB family exonuclease